MHIPDIHAGRAEDGSKGVKRARRDVQTGDHLLATEFVEHELASTHPYRIERYKVRAGRGTKDDRPKRGVAHRILIGADGIPGIEAVGSELDGVAGKHRTFVAYPWRLSEGEGRSVCVRKAVGPDQKCRKPTGVP